MKVENAKMTPNRALRPSDCCGVTRWRFQLSRVDPIDSISPDVVVTTESTGHTETGMATDLAGNSVSTAVTVNVDKTQPAIRAVVNPPAAPDGWHHTPPTIHFVASDGLSGIASVTPDVTVTTEGATRHYHIFKFNKSEWRVSH